MKGAVLGRGGFFDCKNSNKKKFRSEVGGAVFPELKNVVE